MDCPSRYIKLPELLTTIYGNRLGQLPQSMYEAIIEWLSKAGKDLMAADSDRQIPLLMTDLKILAKMLATRLSKSYSKT